MEEVGVDPAGNGVEVEVEMAVAVIKSRPWSSALGS